MVSTFARPGDRFVRAATDEPKVSAHAARRPNGDLAVLLINRVPTGEPGHDRLLRLQPGAGRPPC